MIFRDITPRPELQPFVLTHRLVHLYYEPGTMVPKTPYPTRLEQALVFFAHGYINSYDPLTGQNIPIPRNALFGQHVSRLDFQPIVNNDFLMLMVVFQPGGLYRMLALPCHELTQVFCDAESVISAELQNVNDQIANAKDYPSIIERAEEYLMKKIKNVKIGQHPIDRIGSLLMMHPTPFSLDYLADQSCLSPRQFERKFNERIGIGPKLFSRIGRFFKTLSYKESHPDLDWLTIAINFGYTDYNHLVKDFRQFANVTPNLIIKEYMERPEFVINNELIQEPQDFPKASFQ